MLAVTSVRGVVGFCLKKRNFAKSKKSSSRWNAQWYEKIKRYSKWLTGNKRVSGREHLLDITDPHATPALIYFFVKAKRQENVEILARALIKRGDLGSI